MFRCDECKKATGPSIPVTFVVVRKRKRTYTNSQGMVSQGWEIELEHKLCPDCASESPLVAR